MNYVYQVMHIEESATVCEPDGDHDINLIWADGMVGVSPIFATREQAEAYADGHSVEKFWCRREDEDDDA